MVDSSTQVVSTRIVRIPCPIYQEYERGGSAAQLAARYAQLRRAVDECMFSDALGGREPAERAALVDEVFKRVEESILQSKVQEYTHPIHVISLRRLAWRSGQLSKQQCLDRFKLVV